MAKPNNLYNLTAATALIFLIACQCLSARPLNDGLAATEPALLNLALAGDDDAVQSLPCESESAANFDVRVTAPERVVRGRYGALFLNMLPKGSVPPSGPSKRINDVNN